MVRKYRCTSLYKVPDALTGRNVIIWGISVSGLDAFVWLEANGIIVQGFTDSFAHKDENRSFAGCRVYSYDELSQMENICIFVSTTRDEYLFDILAKTDKLVNAVIYVSNFIYGPGEYDTELLSEMVKRDSGECDLVRRALCDEKSRTTFDNLLLYRKTNDISLIANVFETSHPQYFPGEDIMIFGDHEVFVDAGAYNGATSCVFSQKMNGKYDRIYLMEPDTKMFTVAKEYVKLKNLHDTIFVKKGAYSDSSTLHFKSDFQSGSSNICDEGEYTIDTISIDEMLCGERCSFIKMDIEGAEREALEGCKKTIQQYHPKLAISIYHLPDDLWKIPYMIMNKYPFYKLYMRHYTNITTETVLYAVPEE